MIPYLMIIILQYPTFVTSIEFNSAQACFEQKEKMERVLEKQKPLITCVKK